MEPNAFLVKFIEHNPNPMWISDDQGTLIRLNQAFRDMFRMRGDELVGKYNIFRDGVMAAQGFLPLIRRVFAEGKPARFCSEYDTSRGKSPDPKERAPLVLDVTISPVFDGRERVTHAIFQGIDITENKRAEELLRESENKYRSIFETTGTATMIVEEDSTVSLANAELEKLSGYSRAEIEGKIRWTDFVVEEDLERMKEYHSARRKDPGSAPRNYEFRLRDKQGNVKNVFLTVALVAGTRKSVASLLDITERKRAEEALRESEERWQFALEGAGDGVWDWNAQTDRVHFSRQWKAMLGYEEAEIGDSLDEWSKRVHPDDRRYVVYNLTNSGMGILFDRPAGIPFIPGINRVSPLINPPSAE